MPAHPQPRPSEPAGPPGRDLASRCPLCGEPNGCQLCTTAAYKGPCWCVAEKIPAALLARVPADLRNRACICRDCITTFQSAPVTAPRAGEFYFASGLLVFTEAYHRRRGYCCGSGCRHCPYPLPR